MHYAYMAASTKSRDTRVRIEDLLDRPGWTQQRLAAELGITQGHLSKLKRGVVPGSRDLIRRIEAAHLGKGESPRREPWLSMVQQVARGSRDAKLAIEAIVRLTRRPNR
jgi:transcriptional regulator with XRE-family HTH domain